MADIRLRIEVNPNAETETLGIITNKVDGTGTNSNISNVSFEASSSGVYTNTSNPNENGREMLSWANNGILKFNNEGYLSTNGITAGKLSSETNPDMFVWGAVPTTKKYSVMLTFSNASSLKDIIVYGDKTSNQFPTRAVVDGETVIYSDDYKWAINLLKESDTHTIEFTDWNRANYNACLTLIRVMLKYYEINKYNGLKDIDSLSEITPDAKSINYGVLPNTGSANIIDIDGEINDMINDKIISNSNNPVELLINNTNIASHIINDSNYLSDNSNFNIVLTNKIESFKNININFLLPFFSKRYKQTFYETILIILINNVFNNNQDNAQSFLDILTGEYISVRYNSTNSEQKIKVSDYLKRLVIEDGTFYIAECTFYDFLDKICKATQLNLYEKDNGDVVFISARPIAIDFDKIYKIPRYLQISEPSADRIIKNKVDRINVSYNNVYDECQDIAKFKAYLRNRDTLQLDLSALDSGQIITQTSTGYKYLCFFITITSTDYIFDNTNKNFDNIYATNIIVNYTDGSSSESARRMFYGVPESKQNYNFNNYINSETPTTIPVVLGYNQTGNSITMAITQSLTEDESKLDSVEVRICPRARKSVASDKTIGNGENLYNFNYNNELIGSNVRLYSENIIDGESSSSSEIFYDCIFNNILNDYKDGVRTASLSIFCDNIYDINDNMSINWRNGELLKVGDLIRIDKDNNGTSFYKYYDNTDIIWKIIGRKLIYDGFPKLNLELQEVVNLYSIISFKENSQYFSIIITDEYGNEIKNKQRVINKSKIKINVTMSTSATIVLDSIIVNGTTIDNGSIYEITDDTTIVVKYKILYNYEDEKYISENGTYIISYSDGYDIKDNTIHLYLMKDGVGNGHQFTNVDNSEQKATVNTSYGSVDFVLNNIQAKATTPSINYPDSSAVGSYFVVQFAYWKYFTE